MKTSKWISFILLPAFLLCSVSTLLAQPDYKTWIPLLPKSVKGLPPSGTPEGINMQMGGQSWCSLKQTYARDGGEKSIDLIIVQGVAAPQLQAYQAIPKMEIETGDAIVKTVTVAGYRAFCQVDKNDKRGTLSVAVANEVLVLIEVEPTTGCDELTGIASEVPLSKFAVKGN